MLMTEIGLLNAQLYFLILFFYSERSLLRAIQINIFNISTTTITPKHLFLYSIPQSGSLFSSSKVFTFIALYKPIFFTPARLLFLIAVLLPVLWLILYETLVSRVECIGRNNSNNTSLQ